MNSEETQLINNLSNTDVDTKANTNFYIDLQPSNKTRKRTNANTYDKNNYSNLTKIILHTNSIFGPGIICLPFILQHAGFIPTLAALIFISYLSLITSSCVNETNKIINNINYIDNLNNDDSTLTEFSFFKMIDKTVKDSFFNYAAKFFVVLNHFAIGITCIMTLSKSLAMIVPQASVGLSHKNSLNEFLSRNMNYEIMMLGVIFLIFIVVFYVNKYFKVLFNYLLSGVGATLLICIIVHLIKLKELFNFKKIPVLGSIGEDHFYLFGPLVISFSYMSIIPSWMEDHRTKNCSGLDDNTRLLRFSLLYGIFYKILFSVVFSLIIIYGPNFSFNFFISSEFNLLKAFSGIFLFLIILNNVIIHTELNCDYLSEDLSDWVKRGLIAFTPWFISLILLMNEHNSPNLYLNFVNWSSLIILAFTNFVLPILLYLEASSLIKVFENNYKESALLDFENFLTLKSQEIGLEITNQSQNEKFFEEIEKIKKRIETAKKENNFEQTLEEKEELILRFYENEGHYSTVGSVRNITGFMKTRKGFKIFCYIIIGFFGFMVLVSEYLSLYHTFMKDSTKIAHLNQPKKH